MAERRTVRVHGREIVVERRVLGEKVAFSAWQPLSTRDEGDFGFVGWDGARWLGQIGTRRRSLIGARDLKQAIADIRAAEEYDFELAYEATCLAFPEAAAGVDKVGGVIFIPASAPASPTR
jgi:hypothetical protein